MFHIFSGIAIATRWWIVWHNVVKLIRIRISPTVIMSNVLQVIYCWTNAFIPPFFQDGPLRIEATSTGSNSTISKIVNMVSLRVCLNVSSHWLIVYYSFL